MKKKNKKKIKKLEKNLDKTMEALHLLWLGDWSSISGAKHYGDFAEEIINKIDPDLLEDEGK